MERVAEEGVSVADGSGGDRVVQTSSTSSTRGRKARHWHDLQELLGRAEKYGYRQRLESFVDRADRPPRASSPRRSSIAVSDARAKWESAEEANRLIESPVSPMSRTSAFKREIEQLNRRIAKLTGSLGPSGDRHA